jgi:hypothetical protein
MKEAISKLDPDVFKPEYLRKPEPKVINTKKADVLDKYLKAWRLRKHRIVKKLAYRYI